MSLDSSPEPSFGERLAGAFIQFVRALVRLLLLVMLAAVLGGAAYFGVPFLYRTYVQPVEDNSARIAALEARLDVLEAQVSQQHSDATSRLNTLETHADQADITLEDLQARVAAAESALQDTQGAQEDLLQQLDGLQQQLDALGAALDDLGQVVADNQQAIGELDARWTALDTPVAALRREVAFSRVMIRLTRARIFLAHNNFGLAAEEVATAIGDLEALRPAVAAYQQEAFQTILDRLAQAQANLPAQPVLAAEDLEAAWQMLNAGLPAEPPLAEATITATPPTAETPTPEVTPTPTPSP